MKKKKQDNFVHYLVHPVDRPAWGSDTVCGKKAGKNNRTFDHSKVTCEKCLRAVRRSTFMR